MSSRYGNSERQLATARNLIPLGAQTFSKSVTQLPLGVAPFFAERARGSRLFDVDGNEYVDFINALAAVSLGYCDPDVDAAVVEQQRSGTIFSLHPRLFGALARDAPARSKFRFICLASVKHPKDETPGRRARGLAWSVLKMSACATGWERKS
jgi:glutamate-1-semialdehyde aminotransferase